VHQARVVRRRSFAAGGTSVPNASTQSLNRQALSLQYKAHSPTPSNTLISNIDTLIKPRKTNSSVMNSLSASDVFVLSGPVTGFQLYLYFQQASIAPMAASKLWRVMDQGDRSAWVSKATALMPSAGKKTKKSAAKKKKPVAGGSASRKVPKVTGTKKATAAKKKPVSLD
jgi:hypothetical protein